MRVLRHVWRQLGYYGGAVIWSCHACLMRRRYKKRRWEYLPAIANSWKNARRLCGPCPGEIKK